MQACKVIGRKAGKLLTERAHIPYVGPVSFWIILFVIAPLGVILYFSFLRGIGPTIVYTFNLENYRALLRPGYVKVFLRTLLFGTETTIACLLLGYLMAYWIVRHGGRRKPLFLFLIILPSWTSLLVRVYALRTVAGYEGCINSALLSLGLISSPLQILYSTPAVIFGLIYTWIPFMVLPIYAALEGLNPALLEAAVDLGATPFRRFFTVTLPLTKGGIYAGTILVFIPSLGAWLIPELLGGSKTMMVGNLVVHNFIVIGNFPRGAALGVVVAAMVTFMLLIYAKIAAKGAIERIV